GNRQWSASPADDPESRGRRRCAPGTQAGPGKLRREDFPIPYVAAAQQFLRRHENAARRANGSRSSASESRTSARRATLARAGRELFWNSDNERLLRAETNAGCRAKLRWRHRSPLLAVRN